MIAVVIPAYNEEKRVANVVDSVLKVADTAIVVDDCSSDKTAEEAKKAGAIVLRHLINRGQGAALQTATDYALRELKADIVVHFDADGQMEAEEIKKIIQPIINGEADVVLGSRFIGVAKDIPASRRLLLKAALLFTLIMTGIKVSDTHNGFRALSARAAENMRISLDRMAHASEILEMIKENELSYVEVPVTIKYYQETLRKGQSAFGALTVIKDILKSKFL
ncbi:glycosyltransferase family 2 protein [Candidatus Parcubacteria bacterium]|nr:MAG: glycosyltransferase family 2 protein [Candidatus Parcubacteria bacterium]